MYEGRTITTRTNASALQNGCCEDESGRENEKAEGVGEMHDDCRSKDRYVLEESVEVMIAKDCSIAVL